MNDQEAYIIMQAENRERKDISDYVRACSYKRALDNELFKTRTELAEMERLSNSVISYYLGFAGLSQEVVKEFKNISLIGLEKVSNKAHQGGPRKSRIRIKPSVRRSN